MGNICDLLITKGSSGPEVDHKEHVALEVVDVVFDAAMHIAEPKLRGLSLDLISQQQEVDNHEIFDDSPKIVLMEHQHSLFCERKQRVCDAVGKMQELETIKVVGLNFEEVQIGKWIRLKHEEISDGSSRGIVIEGSESCEFYRLTASDVGFYITYRFSIRTEPISSYERSDEDSNCIQVCDERCLQPVGPVLPGPPRLLEITITGLLVVDSTVMAVVDYIGGTEGSSEYWWMKVTPDGKRVQLSDPSEIVTQKRNYIRNDFEPSSELHKDDPRYYTIKEDDVGCQLKVKCRPVRIDGVKGEIFTSKSSGIILHSSNGSTLMEVDQDSSVQSI